MKLKLGEMLDAGRALQELLALNGEARKLPVKIGWRAGVLLDQMMPYLKRFDEQRVVLAKEYGTLSEDGQTFQIKPENMEAFQKALQPTLDEDIDVPEKLLLLEDFGPLELDGGLIFRLRTLIKE